MCKACGLYVSSVRNTCGLYAGFPHDINNTQTARMENLCFFLSLHKFYTQSFTAFNIFFLSVIYDFYTVCTRLIITKTKLIT